MFSSNRYLGLNLSDNKAKSNFPPQHGNLVSAGETLSWKMRGRESHAWILEQR